ncbi:kinesin-like protein Nod isoform X2 [Eurosta solidaginis]
MGLNSNCPEGGNVGIIPRCFSEILSSDPNAETDKANKVGIYASFIEIYNEKVFDLLSDNTTEPIISRGYKYTGGTRKQLETVDDCYSVLQQGNKNRHVRPTKMNSQSSRSHAIFTIHVSTVCEKGLLNTRLNLVDLAGSEGVRRTGHQGVAMSEGVNINQGLLSIGKVLQAKALGYKVIPYRDSVLTLVLQDSLNENSYLTLLACISPHRADLSETLSTLRFAQSVKQLKHSPHINVILAESKKPRMKTPKRLVRTPTTVKRPYSKASVDVGFKAAKPIYHSNTFCTPSKLKRNPVLDKLNRSEMGLTPKQKEKEQSSLIPSLVPVPRSTMHSNAPHGKRESSVLLDQSLDSRASILSINVSSSTIFGNDGTTSSKFMSYSPVVRKCMVEIENVMENKMSQLMETLKDLNKENFQQRTIMTENTPCSTPWAANNNVTSLPLALRQELKSIIQEALNENTDPKSTPLENRNDSPILESSILDTNPKCQLFITSSPVFKVPAVPNRELVSAESTMGIASDELEESKRTKNQKRRSRRISHRLQHGSLIDVNCESDKALRRSSRLSIMTEGMEISSESLSELSSRRKSIRQLDNKMRQSVRHAAHVKELQSDKGKCNSNSKRTKNVQNCIAALNNSTIEGYFDHDSNSLDSDLKSKKQNIKKHRKAILDLLNTGSMKELQILPQIGQKTAFQLITQRTLSGKFKNLTQLEKLPIWRGNSWARFAQANLLVD